MGEIAGHKAQVIAFLNQKGGTGKTTSSVNCAGALRELKQRVLIIDLDSQSNVGDSYGIRAEGDSNTIYHLLKGQVKFEKCIRRVHGIDLIPSSIELANGEMEFISEPGREQMLRRALGPHLKKYDFVILDCAPNLGVLTQNALALATQLVVVFRPDNYSLLGTARLMQTIEVFKDRVNPDLDVCGFLANGFDIRNTLDKQVLDLFKREFQDKVFKQVVRQNVRLREMPAHKSDVFIFDPECNGAQDFLAVTKEIIDRSVVQ